MSPAELSDRQLDTLLALVDPPPPPSSDLAERIAARATPTQSARAPYSAPPRHRPKRHRIAWSAFIGANVLAAAAAASSWDGQRFDFHRLTDLPHRVALAIHLPRKDKHHELALREPAHHSARLIPHAPSASIPPAARQIVRGPVTHQISIPVQAPEYPARARQLAVRTTNATPDGHKLRAVRQDHLARVNVRSEHALSSPHRWFAHRGKLNEPVRAEKASALQQRSSEIAPPTHREERQTETISNAATAPPPPQKFDIPRENGWRERAQGSGSRMRGRPFASSPQRPKRMDRMPRGHRGFRRFGRRF